MNILKVCKGMVKINIVVLAKIKMLIRLHVINLMMIIIEDMLVMDEVVLRIGSVGGGRYGLLEVRGDG